MKSLLFGQHFPESTEPSRAGNSHDDNRNWAKIEFVQDFMHVLVMCKFDEDPTRNEVSISQTTFLLYVYGRLKEPVTRE